MVCVLCPCPPRRCTLHDACPMLWPGHGRPCQPPHSLYCPHRTACPYSLYLRLSRVYREKAERDVAAVEAHVGAILQRLGREPGSISREAVRLYCKNARNLRLARWVHGLRFICWSWMSGGGGMGMSTCTACSWPGVWV